eukprot:gnl/TRDRNA2_/TRDRNA2_116163_c0_seq1.p1 gnl/TRDRNA2_/TRDRNA2_116163_c0~~gnl/TRDRNA2_/TRDRNA2_116163_c0_seq1.p1  ORF type:complete len:204 (+),score=24.32 gnl/TRDRNA2_/TRDRNA2_116163_c0_seq1:56-613(+)
MKFYEESFPKATAQFDMDPYKTCKSLFRAGDPANKDQRSGTCYTRQRGGWFGGPGMSAPDVPRDASVVSETDLSAYSSSLKRNGFFGPDSYYMNHEANRAYAARAVNGGRLAMPVLFVAAEYDAVCHPSLAKEMPNHCDNLTTASIESGHWMAQEKPVDLNAVLVKWLASKVTSCWPAPSRRSKL